MDRNDGMDLPGCSKLLSLNIDYDMNNLENQDFADEEEYLEEEEDDEKKQFRFDVQIFLRNFRGHKKGPTVGKINVNCDSVEEVMELVWTSCESHIRREVVFDAPSGVGAEQFSARWADTTTPTIEEADKFLTFQDEVSKRNYKPSQFIDKPEKMQKYLNKEISDCVYVFFSESVTSANMYVTLHSDFNT